MVKKSGYCWSLFFSALQIFMVCCARTAAWAGCREAQVPGSFFLALSSVTRASQNFAELLQDLPGPSILSDILLEVLAGLLGCQAFRETGGSIQVPRDVYRALFQLSLQPGWSHKHQRLTSAWHSWQCGSRPIRCYHPIFELFSQFLLDISGITNSRGPICMWIYSKYLVSSYSSCHHLSLVFKWCYDGPGLYPWYSYPALPAQSLTADTIPPEELSKDEPESATGSTEARSGSNETATSTRHEIPSKFTSNCKID